MNTKFDLTKFGVNRVAYVKPVNTVDLPEDLRAQIGTQGIVYALYSGSDGERLAFVRDRSLAYIVARQNDLAPMSVH